MVAPPLVTDVYQVTTLGLLNTMPCDHVIHWHIPGLSASAASLCSALVDADIAQWNSHLGTSLPPFYEQTGARAVYLGNLTTPPASKQVANGGRGTGTYGSHATCVTIRHHVPLRGRGKQGRTNIPGPAAESLTQPSGQLTDTAVSAYNQAFKGYVQDIQATISAGFGVQPELVVLARKLGTYTVPTLSECDILPNTHRRWQKRLARH